MKYVHSHTSRTLYTLCAIGLLYTLHVTLPVYINSSFLGQFMSEGALGLIYITASIAGIVGYLQIHRFLRAFGNYATTISLIVIESIALVGLAFTHSVWLIVALFVVSSVSINLIGLAIDLFLESYSDNKHTGGIRGLFMTSTNIAWILSPILAASLIDGNQYWKIYIAAVGLLAPLIYMLAANFKDFKDAHYPRVDTAQTIAVMIHDVDYRKIFIANTILQAFYAWMIIYTPLYLHNVVGFGWDAIGLIFTIMLLPFILFEFPAGKLADQAWGERRFMALGFLIMSISTIGLAYIHGADLLAWSVGLFCTRIGASITETMIETYFFKRIHAKDSNILSLFRTTRPLAYMIVPIIATALLLVTDYRTMFIVLGSILLSGIVVSLRLTEDRGVIDSSIKS